MSLMADCDGSTLVVWSRLKAPQDETELSFPLSRAAKMILVLAVLTVLACSQAKPNTVPENSVTALVVPQTAADANAVYTSCPDGYFDAMSTVSLVFKRGTQAKRNKTHLKNEDQIQCSKFPDLVACDLSGGIITIRSADPKVPLLPKIDFDLDCELDSEKPLCFLKDSCLLRCNSGLSTPAIIAIVVAVLLAVGLIAVLVKRFRH